MSDALTTVIIVSATSGERYAVIIARVAIIISTALPKVAFNRPPIESE